ncbi:MAG: hypothetical protein ACI9R3_000221 [Verrucomicrobiales bacterium]|jgi:hypothetical protein
MIKRSEEVKGWMSWSEGAEWCGIRLFRCGSTQENPKLSPRVSSNNRDLLSQEIPGRFSLNSASCFPAAAPVQLLALPQ